MSKTNIDDWLIYNMDGDVLDSKDKKIGTIRQDGKDPYLKIDVYTKVSDLENLCKFIRLSLIKEKSK